MKTTQQIKTLYQSLLAVKWDSRTGKEFKKAQKKAGKLRVAILWLDAGVTEASLVKQKADILRTLGVLDSRFTPTKPELEKAQYKIWKKENDYAKLRKSLADINWILNL